MITLENVSKRFLNEEILMDINLTIPTGSRTYIKGTNGSGKSVLLRIISGYLTPSSGEVIVDDEKLGENIDFIPNAGMFINAPEFMESWTGWENLFYLARYREIATEDSILELAKKVGLENDLDKQYKVYSLGMRQKLRIIQALMDKPNYLILDEPFDALDKGSREKVLTLLNDYLNEDANRTLVYTSHNDSMETFADFTFEIIEKRVEHSRE